MARGSRDKKVLIVISDGGDNASAHTLADVLQAGNKSNIQVFTIGIFDPDDPDKNPAVLRQLALATGGEAFVPDEVERSRFGLREHCQGHSHVNTRSDICRARRRRAGGYHSIKVLARGTGKAKLHVRTRSGYSGGGR